MKEILALWTLTLTLKAINQTKEIKTFIFDKYFKGKGKGVMGNEVTIKIKKGNSYILKAIAPGAERLLKSVGDSYELTIKLPRFGLSGLIEARELNEFNSLEGKDKVQGVSQKVAEILKEHKDSYKTTLEYMSIGAMFGKVMDGAGKVLFEFTATTTKINFKGKEAIFALSEIDEKMTEEFGNTRPYSIYADKAFLNSVSKDALNNDLFKQGNAKWIQKDGTRVLDLYGVPIVPYAPMYQDEEGKSKKYLKEGEAIAVPEGEDIFQFIYGRADHTLAVSKAPTLFFAAPPEELGKGRGWSIETEMKPLTYCVRPGGIIKLKHA
jgi:hypothetical protein